MPLQTRPCIFDKEERVAGVSSIKEANEQPVYVRHFRWLEVSTVDALGRMEKRYAESRMEQGFHEEEKTGYFSTQHRR